MEPKILKVMYFAKGSTENDYSFNDSELIISIDKIMFINRECTPILHTSALLSEYGDCTVHTDYSPCYASTVTNFKNSVNYIINFLKKHLDCDFAFAFGTGNLSIPDSDQNKQSYVKSEEKLYRIGPIINVYIDDDGRDTYIKTVENRVYKIEPYFEE